MTIPWELKYDFAVKGWASSHRGFLYAVREEYGAADALKIYESVCNIDDRVKNLTIAIRTLFNLEENDAETIGEVLDIWDEFIGTESSVLGRSPTINHRKVTQCPLKTGYEDISDWSLIYFNIIGKTINSKAALERPRGMCAGDPHCEYIWKLDESTQLKEAFETKTRKVGVPWELKYKLAMTGWVSNHKGWLYAVRDKYGADKALEIYARFQTMGDRVKNLTNTFRTIFNIEGNDATTIGKCWDVWNELIRQEYTILERSKTIDRRKITRCPWKTEPRDISDWSLTLRGLMAKIINPKATIERPKAMCAGDPYCEYVGKIED